MALKIINDKIKLSNLFCDGITLIAPVTDSSDPTATYDRLCLLTCGNEYGYSVTAPGYAFSRRLFTDQECVLPSHQRRTMLFQIARNSIWDNRYRIKFNPNLDDLGMVRELTSYVTGEPWESLVSRSRVSRVDIAVDVEGGKLTDLVLQCKHAHKSNFHQNMGVVETAYFGTWKSNWQWCCYNKKVESGLADDCVRFEVRHRPSPSVEFSDLASYENPFTRLRVSDVSLVKKSATEVERLTIAVAQGAGLKRAFMECSESTKKAIAKKLDIYRPNWWEPTALWKQWNGVLQGINDLPKSPCFIDIAPEICAPSLLGSEATNEWMATCN